MGDRTYVEITIRTEDFEKLIKNNFNNDKEEFVSKVYCEDITTINRLTCISANEINYAEWDELQDLLMENMIEFDKKWEAGGNYSSGEAFYRLIDGKIGGLEILERETDLYNFIDKAIKVADPSELQKLIQEKYEELYPFGKILPLDAPQSIRFITEND